MMAPEAFGIDEDGTTYPVELHHLRLSGSQLDAWAAESAERSAERRAEREAQAPLRAVAFILLILGAAFLVGLLGVLALTA